MIIDKENFYYVDLQRKNYSKTVDEMLNRILFFKPKPFHVCLPNGNFTITFTFLNCNSKYDVIVFGLVENCYLENYQELAIFQKALKRIMNKYTITYISRIKEVKK